MRGHYFKSFQWLNVALRIEPRLEHGLQGSSRSSPCLVCQLHFSLSLLAFLPTSTLPTPRRNLGSSSTSKWFALPKDFVLFHFPAFPLAFLSGKCLSRPLQNNPPHPSCSGRYYRPWEALPDGPVWVPRAPRAFFPVALITITQNVPVTQN